MAHYDIASRTYDDWYAKPVGKFIDELQTKLVFEKLNPKPGMHILDVGCGTGNFSIKLAKMGCKVTAVDVSDGMLEKARRKSENLAVEFLNMNAVQLHFPDNLFDAVLSVTAFEFIADNQRAFDEMLRVVKSGAKIVVGTLHKNSNWGKFYESEEMRKNSIFKYAFLKTKDDLESYNPDKFINIGECLHVNPTFDESEFTLENEHRLKSKNSGGFICGLWKK